MRRSVLTATRLVFILSCCAILFGPGAAATPMLRLHSTMLAATPAPGSTVDSFDEVTIEFEGDLDAESEHTITVQEQQGNVLETVAAELVSPTLLTARISEPDSGIYVVRYDIVSADEGLAQNGNYIFTFEKPPSETPLALLVGVGSALVVLALGGLVARLMRRRGRGVVLPE